MDDRPDSGFLHSLFRVYLHTLYGNTKAQESPAWHQSMEAQRPCYGQGQRTQIFGRKITFF